nr:MAG TPA: hypothetical protein [Caudoviricetes sp.]
MWCPSEHFRHKSPYNLHFVYTFTRFYAKNEIFITMIIASLQNGFTYHASRCI